MFLLAQRHDTSLLGVFVTFCLNFMRTMMYKMYLYLKDTKEQLKRYTVAQTYLIDKCQNLNSVTLCSFSKCIVNNLFLNSFSSFKVKEICDIFLRN